MPSLDGRRFVDATVDHAGDVGADTRFEYHEEGDVVWARYLGGVIRLGFLVGTRTGDDLEFRYSHVTQAGETASGHCTSTIRMLDDGRLQSQERWAWTSKPGSGTSTLVELDPSHDHAHP
jgi:hypothetical protein